MEFEKSLEEKVRELQKYIQLVTSVECYKEGKIGTNMFNSIYASINELGKHIDAHIDVEAEEMQSLAKSKKQLLQ